MFSPEFVNEQNGTVVLVASHNVATPESLALSTAFNRARIAFGKQHVPPALNTWRVFYDVRGQGLPDTSIAQIHAALDDLCQLDFER